MWGLDIHKNSPVSVSLALAWQWTNSSQLTWEWSLVHRRWVSCLRPRACLHWSSNQGLSLLHIWWPLLEHNVQTAGRDVRLKPQQDCQQEKCYARADSVLHHRLDGAIQNQLTIISVDSMFEGNFHSYTQVWNCLSHRNDCRQRLVIWVTNGCCNSNPY